MNVKGLKLETIRIEQAGRVVTAYVADPPFNYMTARMQADLDVLSRAVDDDPSVGAVVLTGGVDGRFITHFDISDILESAQRARVAFGEGQVRGLIRALEAAAQIPQGTRLVEKTPLSGLLNVTRFNEVVLRIMRSPAVWIAAINGPCGGGGLEMSVCFDVRIAADTGTGFILPELLIGLTTTVGAQRLVQLVGPARALEIMLEGRVYTADEMLGMGVLGRVVPSDQLLDEALAVAHRYARRPRNTVAAQKRIFNEYALMPPAESFRHESAAQVAGILSGPAPQALTKWIDMQHDCDGDSVFLRNLEPWTDGTAVDLNGGELMIEGRARICRT